MIRVYLILNHHKFADCAGGVFDVPVHTHKYYKSYKDMQVAILNQQLDIYSIAYVEQIND